MVAVTWAAWWRMEDIGIGSRTIAGVLPAGVSSTGRCPSRRRHSLKSSRAAEVYLRFLQLSEAIRGLPALPPLDPLEERILAWVARASQDEQRLSVRDMLGNTELGAPATIHARLKSMREKGWIMLVDTEDTRRKQVALTDDALAHFARLSRAMVKATRA
jgi:DNA-binding MarR family transcriptional regulator